MRSGDLPVPASRRIIAIVDVSISRSKQFHSRFQSLVLHRALARGIDENPELATKPGGASEVRLIGLDPIRVLVIGSGLAVGYGVKRHSETLTGALAEAIQHGGSRGVIVQNRAVGKASAEQTVAELGLVGATACNLVVWCPSLLDVLRRPDRGTYHRTLMDGLRLLRDTARPGAEIVVCALPVPTKRGALEEIARNVVPQFNRALARAVAALPDVRYVEPPRFTTLLDAEALSPEYYRQVAEAIVRPEATEAVRSA